MVRARDVGCCCLDAGFVEVKVIDDVRFSLIVLISAIFAVHSFPCQFDVH